MSEKESIQVQMSAYKLIPEPMSWNKREQVEMNVTRQSKTK